MSLRIGFDVGGTNTDAVVLDEHTQVIARAKVATTTEPLDGVAQALDEVLGDITRDVRDIRHVMLGTTHCTNAILQRRGLGRVGVLRLGAPSTTAVLPMEDWPADLRAAIGEHAYIVSGGYEVDGRVLAPIDLDEIDRCCEQMRGEVDAVAVVGVFATVNAQQENEVAARVTERLGLPVCTSAQIGALGLLERENATILNAALIDTLASMASGFERIVTSRGIEADLFFGQNDGTLMSSDFAARYPVLTIGCGPTNSIRGAAHLAGRDDAIVVDIGGTSTDLGVLSGGFPRQSARAVDIGGIRTNFRMPDVLSIALGGGTRIRRGGDDEASADRATVGVGPDSVGFRLRDDALCFGGGTVTATDIAVARFGRTLDGATAPSLDSQLIDDAGRAIDELLADAIDRMKSSGGDATVLLVGGGSIIAADQIVGVSELIRPDNFDVANAVGAALGDVSGQCEQIIDLNDPDRAAVLEAARVRAIDLAVAAGADRASTVVINIEQTPLPYAADASAMLLVRAAGTIGDLA